MYFCARTRKKIGYVKNVFLRPNKKYRQLCKNIKSD